MTPVSAYSFMGLYPTAAPEGDGQEQEQQSASDVYSPPQLVGAVHDASARSGRLGVEGIFSAMAHDDTFMNEVAKPPHCLG